MVTPTGVWESRRLPGSGAGPSPDRMAIGSEGILGIITEAWMRIQARPQYRASAGVTFPSFMAGSEGARRVVQAKLWPANCRLLDPGEAQAAAGMDGSRALLIIGFESSDLPQDDNIRQAVSIARDAGGTIAEEDIRISAPGDRSGDSSGGDTGRQGAVGAWRNAFIGAPYQRNITTGLGLVAETLETAITWERWPAMDEMVRGALQENVGPRLRRRLGVLPLHPRLPRRPGPLLHLGRHGTARRGTGDVRRDQAGCLRRHHGRWRHHHPPPRRGTPAPPVVRPAAPRTLRRGSPRRQARPRPHGVLNPACWWTSSLVRILFLDESGDHNLTVIDDDYPVSVLGRSHS